MWLYDLMRAYQYTYSYLNFPSRESQPQDMLSYRPQFHFAESRYSVLHYGLRPKDNFKRGIFEFMDHIFPLFHILQYFPDLVAIDTDVRLFI